MLFNFSCCQVHLQRIFDQPREGLLFQLQEHKNEVKKCVNKISKVFSAFVKSSFALQEKLLESIGHIYSHTFIHTTIHILTWNVYFTALKCTFQNHKKLSHNEKEPQKSHKKCFKWKKIIIEKKDIAKYRLHKFHTNSF